MVLYLLDYGAGNVRSVANSLKKLGFEFQWIGSPDDFDRATTLIFPGVGAFQSAIDHLQSKGLLQPLKAYVASGRPYFGICIGMQILFDSSAESPGSTGLGIFPCIVERFDNSDKTVPHIGWNSINIPSIDGQSNDGQAISAQGVNDIVMCSAHYYFVHSYRVAVDMHVETFYPWIHATSRYGKEVFVATVKSANIFATQFHPEKSGPAGLRILYTWLKSYGVESSVSVLSMEKPFLVKPEGLTKRIIACMDVRANDEGDLVVTKGDQYNVRERVSSDNTVEVNTSGAVRNLGKPISLALRYYEAGADEICFLNITSFRNSPLQDQPMLAVVRQAAENVFVPLVVGGGIKCTLDPDGQYHSALEVASAYFRAGADKVSIGSEAVAAVEKLLLNGGIKDGTSAIEDIARVYGRQAVVVSIDPKRVYVDPVSYSGPRKDELIFGQEEEMGKAWWYQCTVSGGREVRDLSAVELAKGVEILGAGEILLNSIDRDGTNNGFDLDLIKSVQKAVAIPVIASSGAGSLKHFTDLFSETNVDAALAAGIFHREEVKIDDVKFALQHSRIPARI